MQISNRLFKNVIFPIMTLAAVSIPLKTGLEQQAGLKDKSEADYFSDGLARSATDYSTYYLPRENCITPHDLEGLKITVDTNFVGGISHCFDDESVQKLKDRILMPVFSIIFIWNPLAIFLQTDRLIIKNARTWV